MIVAGKQQDHRRVSVPRLCLEPRHPYPRLLNVGWATVAAINASRVSINTALTLIWHLKKIESNRTQTRLMKIQLTSSGDTLRQATAYGTAYTAL